MHIFWLLLFARARGKSMPEPTLVPAGRLETAPFAGRRLRLGIRDEGQPWPAWAGEVMSKVLADTRIEVWRMPGGTVKAKPVRRCLVQRWFDRFDRRRLRSWLETRGIEQLPPLVIDLPAWPGVEPDIIWHLGELDSGFFEAPPLGVWHYRPQDAMREVFEGESISTTRLMARLADGDHLLGTAEARVHSSSPAITAFQRDEAGARLMMDALERLLGGQWSATALAQRHPLMQEARGSRLASNITLGCWLLSRWIPRVLAAKRAPRALDQWTVGLVQREPDAAPGEIRLDQIAWLTPPSDAFVADPFLWQHEGQWYVFAEVMPFATGKGHLAVFTWSASEGFGPLETVLCEETHLSYPFLFEHEGRLYLIPERYNGGELCAYECVEFPHHWRLARVVKAGLRCADATLLRHEGRWWLFYTAVHGGASEDSLYACYGDTPFGPWTAHPLNPLRSGLRGSRMAGGFIGLKDGRLLRPGQDASARYGGATILHEVDMLTPDHYQEHECAVIDPTRFSPPWNERCHTWNEHAGLIALDACRTL